MAASDHSRPEILIQQVEGRWYWFLFRHPGAVLVARSWDSYETAEACEAAARWLRGASLDSAPARIVP